MTRPGVGDLHLAQHLLGPLQRRLAVQARDLVDLGDLAADPQRRVQRPARLLVDHRDGAWPAASAASAWPMASDVHAALMVTEPALTRPLRGRYRVSASATVDLPDPDSPTSP